MTLSITLDELKHSQKYWENQAAFFEGLYDQAGNEIHKLTFEKSAKLALSTFKLIQDLEKDQE